MDGKALSREDHPIGVSPRPCIKMRAAGLDEADDMDAICRSIKVKTTRKAENDLMPSYSKVQLLAFQRGVWGVVNFLFFSIQEESVS